jgi:uncharacterized protein DUF4124
MSLRPLLLTALLAASLPAHAEFFKCVDSAGKVSYSDKPCQGNDSGGRVVIKESGKFGTRGRAPDPIEQALRLNSSGMQSEDSPQQSSVSSSACADARRSYEMEAGSVRKDPVTTQAKRSAMYVACGMPEPAVESSGRARNSMPVQNRPSVITNCDGAGCWDNQGGRYNSAGGNMYVPPGGGPACMRIAGQMTCP